MSRRRNPTFLDLLPWLLGGAAVVGAAVVVYKFSQPQLTPEQKLAQGIVAGAAKANADIKRNPLAPGA